MRDARPSGMTPLRSILVPTDGSAPSLAALDHALGLAEDYEARLEVLEVEPSKFVTPGLRDDIVATAIARARTTHHAPRPDISSYR